MSEIKDQPFAYDLSLLAREAAPRYVGNPNSLEYVLDTNIKPGIRKILDDKLPRRPQDRWYLVAKIARERIISVEGVAVMITTNHPFIAKWNENDKRYLLDMTLQQDIQDREATLEKAKQWIAYYPMRSTTQPNEQSVKDRTEKIKAIQEKLRQRVSPSHPSTRK